MAQVLLYKPAEVFYENEEGVIECPFLGFFDHCCFFRFGFLFRFNTHIEVCGEDQ
jgi:hypothetical protein